jgi:hypothetical protein
MTPSKEQITKLEQALARAHAAQEAPPFPSGWIYSVMRDIRRQSSSARMTAEVPRLIWRAATVVVFLSVVVVGSVLAWDAERVHTGLSGLFTEPTLDSTLL